MWRLYLVLAVAGSIGLTILGGANAGAVEENWATSELSGVLQKSEKTIMPYLLLDGSDQRCYLRGAPLATHESGTRLHVRGVLRSELFDSTGTDWDKPGMPAPPPLRKGWVVYMEVKEAHVIFGAFERPGGPATTRAAPR
jgi:hypothetical protein